MTHTVIDYDVRAQVRAKLPELLQRRMDRSGNGLRETLRNALESGQQLHDDTQTTSNSIYVQSRNGSDYDSCREKAQEAYLNNESLYREEVRRVLDPEAYTEEHFNERAAPEEPLPDDLEIVTGVATFFAIATLWQMGHDNKFTGRYEQRSWFSEPLLRWASAEWEQYFAGFETELAASI